MPGTYIVDPCIDCRAVEATLDVRKRRLCNDCFGRYVISKVLKRMEAYGRKNGYSQTQRKLLLALSGGTSSMVLLHILDSQLQRQLASRGRVPYDLQILVVDTSEVASFASTNAFLDSLRALFPLYEFSFLPISEVFTLDKDIFEALSHLGLNRRTDESPQGIFERLIGCTTTATAKAEIYDLLLDRLILTHAKLDSCEGVLWGHSDSRLAAKALASVAKGRGLSVPLEILDGPSPAGVNFHHPLRDLSKQELEQYARLLPEELSRLVKHEESHIAKMTTRETSIDDLLAQYINTQGKKYPSIMANVVRTVSKLQLPSASMETSPCAVCTMPILTAAQNESDSTLCNQCYRTSHDIREKPGS
jgi:cytoplasmic tRNA 2-thiolation protein 2